MRFHNLLVIIFLSLTFFSCSDEISSKDFKLKTKDNLKKYTLGSSFELTIDNPKGHEIDSVAFFRGDERLNGSKITLNEEKLGTKVYYAKIYVDNTPYIRTLGIVALTKQAPKLYSHEIVNTYPHDIKAYTQGLEFYNDTLYEGTGRKGISQLRKLNYKTGEVLSSTDLSPDLFGEGITILNNKVYQLTWQANKGFVYNLDTFDKIKTFNYKKSREGWGLCNDGKVLYKSDGTEKIWILDPETLEEKSFIQVADNTRLVDKINELEFINGKIYANIYQFEGIAIINPKSGAVEGVINGKSFKKLVTQHADLDVLNGIAYNKNSETIFLTGKNWDKLFEIKIK